MAEIRKVSKYGVLLTKREVKMAGYLAKFVFACLWAGTEARPINMQKDKEANVFSHLNRISLVIKGFIS